MPRRRCFSADTAPPPRWPRSWRATPSSASASCIFFAGQRDPISRQRDSIAGQLNPAPLDVNRCRRIWYSSLVRTVRPSGGMADAEVSKTSEGNLVWVRPPPRAPVFLCTSRPHSAGPWRVVSMEMRTSRIGHCSGQAAALLYSSREHAKRGFSPPPERRPRGSWLVRQRILTTQAWVVLVSRRLCVIGSYFCRGVMRRRERKV